MQYKPFKDGVRLSRLGMGIMRLPVCADQPGHPIDYPKAKALIDAAVAAGINYFDTAYIYHGGESEAFTGRALADYPRDSYYVADKFNFQAQPDYRAQFQEQLQRLNMEHIDFYLLHGIQDNFVDDILKCGCIEYFNDLKKAGKIRFLGFSFHAGEESLLRMLSAGEWDFVQIQLNYYDWEYGNQRRLYEMLAERDIPVMVMEPVHGGLLAKLNEKSRALLSAEDPDASYASWAMRWIKSLPGVQVVLSGMGDEAMLADNVRTFSEKPDIDDHGREVLRQAAALLRPDVALPCTGCRYCVPNCPMDLDIPNLLISYNEMKAGGGHSAWRLVNLLALPGDKQPSACVGCGACTEHCPQALPVPDAMREMAEKLARM